MINLILKTRLEFEQKIYDRVLLKKLYLKYNPSVDFDSFLKKAEDIFPKGNCGLTAVYLREKLGGGEIIRGFYKGQPHTFLMIGEKVIDITADQFSGPPMYISRLNTNWRL